MIALLSELTLRRLGGARLRLGVAVLAALLSACLVATGRTAARDLTQGFAGFVAHLPGTADLSIESPGLGTPAERVDQVREIPGVASATPVIQMPVQATDLGESLLLIGVEGGQGGNAGPFHVTAASGDSKAVFVAGRFAAKHGLAPGSPIRLLAGTGPMDFVVRGFLPDSAGVALYDGQVAVMELGALASAFARATLVDRIDVTLSPGADESAVRAALRELCGQGASIDTPAGSGARLRRLVGPLATALGCSAMLVAVAALVSVFAIARVRPPPREDVSVSSARGYSSVEPPPVPALRLAVLGTALFLVAWQPALRQNPVTGVAAVACAVAAAACLMPALVVALCRLAARAATAGGVGPRFGAEYVARTLGRSTAGTLAVTLLLSTSLAPIGWLASLERSLHAWTSTLGAGDLTVTRGSPLLDGAHVVFAGSAAGAVAAVPGVQSVERLRAFEQRTDAHTLRLVATDTAVFREHAARRGTAWTLLRGPPLTRDELEQGPEIVLGEGAAALLGKDVGDLVTVHAPKGDVAFVVRAIAADYSGAEATGVVDRRHLASHWGTEAIDALSVYLAPGTSSDAAAAATRAALGADGSVFVTRTAELRAELARTIAAVFEPARALGHVLAVVALACAAAVLAVTGSDRRAQIYRRFAGAPRRELAAAIYVEAVVRGVSAAVLGTALGVVLAQLSVRAVLVPGAHWYMGISVPWRHVGVLTVAVVSATLLCAIPAARAARALTPE